MLEDITLAAFTLCNSLRVLAYAPQIVRAAVDRSGAEAISFGTWSMFLVSHASATAYAVVNKQDWTMASVFLGNAIGCARDRSRAGPGTGRGIRASGLERQDGAGHRR